MVNYNNYIELDDVTLDDCLDVFKRQNLCAILNDGHLLNFEKFQHRSDNNVNYNREKCKWKRYNKKKTH